MSRCVMCCGVRCGGGGGCGCARGWGHLEGSAPPVCGYTNFHTDPPCVHACVQEVDTGVPDNTVLMVLQRGYAVGDKLVRPALVKVSTM